MGRKRTKAQQKRFLAKQAEHKRKIWRVQSILGNLTGYNTEQRFLAAFENLDVDRSAFPEWYVGIQKTSIHLDKAGVDFIIMTDCGGFNLQVKSSELRAMEFASKGRNKHIPVLAILKKDTPEFIRYQVFNIISELREQRLQKRRDRRKHQKENKKLRTQAKQLAAEAVVLEVAKTAFFEQTPL
ncbi:hypothetical protein IPM19_00810 [bacterium]|nr:MAG: hypothetical protein IPM19_00810 [bacterium]